MPDINTVAMGFGDDNAASRANRIPDEVKRQLLAYQLMQKLGVDQSQPIYNPTLGFAKMAVSGLGGLFEGMAEKREAKAQTDYLKDLSEAGGAPSAPITPKAGVAEALISGVKGLFGGGDSATAEKPAELEAVKTPAAYAAVLSGKDAEPDYGKAIAGIESGGRYDLLGPVVPKTGDRAYGKYQVMGSNVGTWSKEALGTEMTPQDFLKNPDAQEAVFKHRFGQYAQKYGPEGAARAWFAGEGNMNNMGAKDQLGTTVASYAQQFNRGLGSQPPSAQPAPQSSAAPAEQQQMAQAPQAVPVQPPAPNPRADALRRVVGNLRATPQERLFALQQLAPNLEFKEDQTGMVYALDKNNPGAGMRPVGRLQKETFESVPGPEGAPSAQRSKVSGEIKADPRATTATNDYDAYYRQEVAAGRKPVSRIEFANKPTFGDIGPDTAGNDRKGFIDPINRTVTMGREIPSERSAALPAGQPAPPNVTIPGAPPGANDKKWKETATELTAKNVLAGALPGTSEEASKLRKEVADLPSYKNVAQSAPVYKTMVDAASRDNRAADVNLIYGMAKIMDPGSVVRDNEMTIAQAVATLPQHLRATVESQFTGTGRLSPDVREAIIVEAHSRMQSYKTMFDQDAAMYSGIAERSRLRREDVIPDFGTFEPYKATKPAAAPAATNTEPVRVTTPDEARKLKKGTPIILPDGRRGVVP